MVSETLPEQLVVWQDGHDVYTSLANTGVPGATTATGTYPVYARFSSTTMKGTDPDGYHYDVTGVPWVAYFNGGDAVHGYWRYGYGYPREQRLRRAAGGQRPGGLDHGSHRHPGHRHRLIPFAGSQPPVRPARALPLSSVAVDPGGIAPLTNRGLTAATAWSGPGPGQAHRQDQMTTTARQGEVLL